MFNSIKQRTGNLFATLIFWALGLFVAWSVFTAMFE